MAGEMSALENALPVVDWVVQQIREVVSRL